MSWYSGLFLGSFEMYKSTESYRDLGMRYRSFLSGWLVSALPHIWHQASAYFQTSLLLRAVVHTSSNHIPSSVQITQESPERRRGSGQGELHISWLPCNMLFVSKGPV